MVAKPYKILLIGDTKNFKHDNIHLTQISKINKLDEDLDFDCILFSDKNKKSILSNVKYLRSERHYLRAIGVIDADVDFVDFIYSGKEDFFDTIDNIYNRSKLVEHINSDLMHQVLKYLFIRPEKGLGLIRNSTDKYFYYYIIENIFEIDRSSIEFLIEELKRVGLISSSMYVDGCLSCYKCSSDSLQISKTCKKCLTNQIIEQEFLQCYLCEYTGQYEDFIKASNLVCPNCKSNIKTAYEVVNYKPNKCEECGLSLDDSDTKIECLNCGFTHRGYTQLQPHYYYLYRINSENTNKFISFLQNDSFYLFDKLNYTTKEYFRQTLDWLLMLKRRHPEENFNLVKLDLSVKGEELSIRLLASKFKDILRSTDLYCRVDSKRIMLLFPKARDDDVGILIKKVENTTKNAGLDISQFKVSGFKSSELLNRDIDKLFFDK